MSYKMKRDGILHSYLTKSFKTRIHEWEISRNVCFLFWQVLGSLLGSVLMYTALSLIGFGILFNLITLVNGDLSYLLVTSGFGLGAGSVVEAIQSALLISEVIMFMAGFVVMVFAVGLAVVLSIALPIIYLKEKYVDSRRGKKPRNKTLVETFISDKMNKLCSNVEIVDE